MILYVAIVAVGEIVISSVTFEKLPDDVFKLYPVAATADQLTLDFTSTVIIVDLVYTVDCPFIVIVMELTPGLMVMLIVTYPPPYLIIFYA